MRIIFSIIFSTLFCVSLFSQSEAPNTMIEDCLSLHLEYFSQNDSASSDTIFICANPKHTIKYWTEKKFLPINKCPVVLQSPKEICQRVKKTPLYPVYYITLKKISKSEQILYITTVFVKWYNHKLHFANTEANSNYLIDNNHIKRITINGKITQGQTIFSNLRHETTHGIQFEYGGLGFYFRGMGYGIVDAESIYYELQNWQPIAYDLTDEYEAHNNQNLGFRWNGGKNDDRNQWRGSDRETRMQSLINVDTYSILPEQPFSCPNDTRIKSNDTYALPHRERPHNLSYGKSFGTPPLLPVYGMGDVHPIFPQSISILKEDTVFCYNFYITNNAVDSIRLAYFSVKIKGKKYIRRFDNGNYWFMRYKKICKLSYLERFIQNKSIGTVVKPRSIFRYDKDGRLTEYFFIFCGMSFSRLY